MPTPVGHALAGLATAWFSGAVRPRLDPHSSLRPAAVAIACLGAAVAPDVDILFHSHRTYAHSLGAALILWAIVWLTTRRSWLASTVAAAYATHVLLDWLGKDTAPPFGLTALWPFSSRFYVSGANLFMEISRRYWKPDEFIYGNLRAVGWEVIVIGPVAAGAWYLATKRTRELGN